MSDAPKFFYLGFHDLLAKLSAWKSFGITEIHSCGISCTKTIGNASAIQIDQRGMEGEQLRCFADTCMITLEVLVTNALPIGNRVKAQRAFCAPRVVVTDEAERLLRSAIVPGDQDRSVKSPRINIAYLMKDHPVVQIARNRAAQGLFHTNVGKPAIPFTVIVKVWYLLYVPCKGWCDHSAVFLSRLLNQRLCLQPIKPECIVGPMWFGKPIRKIADGFILNLLVELIREHLLPSDFLCTHGLTRSSNSG